VSNWGQFDPNGPIQRYERTGRRSHYLGFVVASAIIVFFAALDSVPALLVAAVTLASIMPGCLTFRELIEQHPKYARIAKVRFRRAWMLVVLGIAFATVIGVQLVVGAAWGGWAAAAIAPLAYLVEFFIARELSGSQPRGSAPG
jgi:hypothetical protein